MNEAKGIKGCLLDGMFRVYDKNAPKDWGSSEDGFRDFEIYHSDLEVVINDFDGEFYFDKDKLYLDHSREVLGKEDE